MATQSHDKIDSLDRAFEQVVASEADHMNQKNSKSKSLKVNLRECQIYEVPSRIMTGAHEHPSTPRAEEVQQQSHKIRPPKLNLRACQDFATTGVNSGRIHEQQAGANVVDIHKHESRTRPSKVKYVDAWQTFVVDVGSSNRLYEHQEWVNGANVQLQTNKSKLQTHVATIGSSKQIHGQQVLATNVEEQEHINKTSPSKLSLGTCVLPILPGI